jgi:hypothetical protein
MRPIQILIFLSDIISSLMQQLHIELRWTLIYCCIDQAKFFSKPDLLKFYICSTITQNELNVMIVIVIESKILETIVGYENIIKDFMSYIYC